MDGAVIPHQLLGQQFPVPLVIVHPKHISYSYFSDTDIIWILSIFIPVEACLLNIEDDWGVRVWHLCHLLGLCIRLQPQLAVGVVKPRLGISEGQGHPPTQIILIILIKRQMNIFRLILC